jgi:uncharacterized membrane protein
VIIIKNILHKINKKAEALSDLISHWFGQPIFLLVHIIWWSAWMLGGVEPYPFGLLTLIVSLEAIVLSGLILNSSNRAADEDRRMMNRDHILEKDTNQVVDRIHDELQDIKTIFYSHIHNDRIGE